MLFIVLPLQIHQHESHYSVEKSHGKKKKFDGCFDSRKFRKVGVKNNKVLLKFNCGRLPGK